MTSGFQDVKPTAWAAPALANDALQSLSDAESRFPISLLATPRRSLICCGPDDTTLEVKDRTQPADFDHLPVEQNGQILGLFNRKNEHGEGLVRDAMEKLNERLLMASDASMLGFLEQADDRPFVFLVEKRGIAGAVTLSDIQKIEARPAFFLRLTLFELLLTDWIRRKASGTWQSHLNSGERGSIKRRFDDHQAAGNEIDEIACASLYPKIKATVAMDLFKGFEEPESTTQQFVDLRDRVVHGQDYAPTQVAALKIPKLMRELGSYITFLREAITSESTDNLTQQHDLES